MQINSGNKEIYRVAETMEIDETMTSAYVKLTSGEILKRCENGEYQSIKTEDRYIPVVMWKDEKKRTDRGFINITAQEDMEYRSYNDYNDETESKGLFSIFKRR